MLQSPFKTSAEPTTDAPAETPLPSDFEAGSDAARAHKHAFSNRSTRRKPFFAYWKLERMPDVCKHSEVKWITREVFLGAALRALPRLKKALGRQSLRGVRVAHLMSANRREDAILRLSAAISGYSVVTINWDADTFERIKYKIMSTSCAAVVHDDYVSHQVIERLMHSVKLNGVHIVPAKCLVIPSDFPVEEECLPAYNERTDELLKAHEEMSLSNKSERTVVFTSGTTSKPKGVRLTYGNMEASSKCILDCLGNCTNIPVDLVIVNPLHHVNSTAIFETALRYPNVRVHLVDRFRTIYWKLLSLAATLGRKEASAAHNSQNGHENGGSCGGKDADVSFRVVAPLVSRHIEFLQNAILGGRFSDKAFLPTFQEAVKPKGVVLFLGSAPVGPSTVETLQRFIGKLPTVRFGSTETCLQVAATPFWMSDVDKMKALKRGWEHTYKGSPAKGFYIGRPHEPITELGVVKSVTEGESGFMEFCEEGEPGYLVCRGRNCMRGYVNADSQPFSEDRWYLGFGDFGFFLLNPSDGCRDYYWTHRAADLIIKGGANYSCQQISEDLLNFLCSEYSLPKEKTSVAVVGVKWRSEHDDDTCVTIELPPQHENMQCILETEFIEAAAASENICKASRPDFVRFDAIPRTFKGAVDIGTLREDFIEYLESSQGGCSKKKSLVQKPN